MHSGTTNHHWTLYTRATGIVLPHNVIVFSLRNVGMLWDWIGWLWKNLGIWLEMWKTNGKLHMFTTPVGAIFLGFFLEFFLYVSTILHWAPKIFFNKVLLMPPVDMTGLFNQVFDLCESVQICRIFSAWFCKDRCTESWRSIQICKIFTEVCRFSLKIFAEICFPAATKEPIYCDFGFLQLLYRVF